MQERWKNTHPWSRRTETNSDWERSGPPGSCRHFGNNSSAASSV